MIDSEVTVILTFIFLHNFQIETDFMKFERDRNATEKFRNSINESKILYKSG